MKKAIAALCLAAAAASPAWAAKIAVFGDNSNVFDFFNDGSNVVDVVTNADLETANFLATFDLFVYVYDSPGTLLTPNLSATAASAVNAFVTGNVVLFASDLADNGFPGDATSTLMTNAAAFAGSKGFIGMLTGACAAMTSNSVGLQSIGLIDGSCSDIDLNGGPGGNPLQIVQPGSPIVTNVPDNVDLGGAQEFFATLNVADQSTIVAYNTLSTGARGIPSIIGFERQTPSVDEPAAMLLMGLGLAAAALVRRRRSGLGS